MSRRPHVPHTTRSARKRREALKRLGIWVFVGVFALSVVGGLFVFLH